MKTYQNLPLAFGPDEEVAPSPRPLPQELQVKPSWQDQRRASLDGNYDVGYELGKGASGSVVLAEDRRSGKYVAIKLMTKQGLADDQLIRMRREYAIMKQMNHRNWIKLIEVIENPEQICLVMEYAACGDLYTHIVSSPNGKLTEKDTREIFVQAAEGIQFLHRCGFIHRDIKPENILLGKKNHVYIADLGYGTVWEKNKITNTPCGSLYYASPEIVRHDGVYVGPEVDVWSLGCVLYVMAAGRLPFHGSSADSTRKLIIRGEYSVPFHISAELKQLITSMLNIEAHKRIDMDTVLAHSWVGAIKPSQGPKRTLARRKSFGSSFASFMGSLNFGSKSKDPQDENSELRDDKDKEKDKEKGKEKEKKEKKEKRPKTRGRRNSDAVPVSIWDKPEKSSSKDPKSDDVEAANKAEKATKTKEERKPGKRRNSFNFGLLTAIAEEGLEAVTEKMEPSVPDAKTQEDPGEKDKKKKEKKGKRKMSSSRGGDDAWGLAVISEDN